MNLLLTKKLKYYLRLQYPVSVVLGDHGMVGTFPDLSGCNATADNATALYARLDDARRCWIRDRVVAGDEIPMPNSWATTLAEQSDNDDRHEASPIAQFAEAGR